MTQSKEHNSQCDFSLGILRMDTRKLTSSVAQHKTGMSKNLWMVRLLSQNVHKAAAILWRREEKEYLFSSSSIYVFINNNVTN